MSAREQFTLNLGHAPGVPAREVRGLPVEPRGGGLDRPLAGLPDQIPGLNIVGPAGCGTTHLGVAWQRRTDAARIGSGRLGRLSPPELLGARRHLLVDGFDAGWPGVPLLHLYNLATQRGGTGAGAEPGAVRGVEILPEDLVSRLRTLAVVRIGQPEDRLLHEVMAKMFRDRQLRVEDTALATSPAGWIGPSKPPSAWWRHLTGRRSPNIAR